MPERFVPQPGTADSPVPLSRRERRGAKSGGQQQPLGGKVNNNGRGAIPARKHINYRRG
ncbi:hypothetical protein [Nocardia terpenica]|uniref:Uncharacterized protein n=1 Tax=Nocardia terpenica TaxID=455432 RepID=A0A6G9Z0J1_9NOCA|nr:hypothetical protein [Nocardia terpenica]QIS19105.1 hypothetical protein F6W96_13225 [Nocardia terpenica]